jgi:hypothetical protein
MSSIFDMYSALDEWSGVEWSGVERSVEQFFGFSLQPSHTGVTGSTDRSVISLGFYLCWDCVSLTHEGQPVYSFLFSCRVVLGNSNIILVIAI